MRTRHHLSIPSLLLAATTLLCAPVLLLAETHVQTLEMESAGFSRLAINTGTGDLEVTGGNGTTVQARLELDLPDDWSAAEVQNFIAEQVEFEFTTADTTLRLDSQLEEDFFRSRDNGPFAWWRDRGSFPFMLLTVTVPAGLDLEIRDGSGGAVISDIDGNLDITDGSGELVIRNISGNVDVHDGSGALEVTGTGGDLDINDGSGNIEVTRVLGNLRITDGSGNIEFSDIGQSATIRDGSGNIDAEDVKGDLDVRDGSGRVNTRQISGSIDIRD